MIEKVEDGLEKITNKPTGDKIEEGLETIVDKKEQEKARQKRREQDIKRQEEKDKTRKLFSDGRLNYFNQNNEKAWEYFDKAIERDVSYYQKVKQLATSGYSEKNIEKQVEFIKEGKKRYNDDMDWIMTEFEFYRILNQWDNAIKTIDEAIEINPGGRDSVGRTYDELRESCLRYVKRKKVHKSSNTNTGIIAKAVDYVAKKIQQKDDSEKEEPIYSKEYRASVKRRKQEIAEQKKENKEYYAEQRKDIEDNIKQIKRDSRKEKLKILFPFLDK